LYDQKQQEALFVHLSDWSIDQKCEMGAAKELFEYAVNYMKKKFRNKKRGVFAILEEYEPNTTKQIFSKVFTPLDI
jgi:hypothetical protein